MKKIPSVLIVDDNIYDIDYMKILIRRTKSVTKVFTALDGQEALDFLENYDNQKAEHGDFFPPTVLLLDINMPFMNGWEFMEAFDKYKEDPRFQEMNILIHSSSIHYRDTEKSESFPQIKEYLNKPIYKDDMLRLKEEYGVKV